MDQVEGLEGRSILGGGRDGGRADEGTPIAGRREAAPHPGPGGNIKNLPAMQETWVRSLGREDPLEEGMATHFSILARRIPWTEEPRGLQSMGSQRVRCA